MNEVNEIRRALPDDLAELSGCAGIINVVFNACFFLAGCAAGATLMAVLA